MRQFSENGSDSTALTYGQQDNDALWSSVGWQVAGNIQGFRPFARVTWEYNFDADTQAGAGASRTRSSGLVHGAGLRAGRQLVAVRRRRQPRNSASVTGFLSGNVSASKGDGDYWAITVGIRVPL